MRTILTALLVLMLCSPSFVWAAGFGNQENEATTTTMENYMLAGVFEVPSTGVLDSIKMYVEVSSAAHLMRLSVYEWNGSGVSGDFVDSTEERDLSVGGFRWEMFHFTQNARIVSGSKYSLVGWGESTTGGITGKRTDQAGDTMFQKSVAYSGAWPSTVSATAFEAIVSVYCYYTDSRFGKDTEGGFTTSIGDVIWANRSSPSSSGTLDGVAAYLTVTTASHNVKCALYLWSDTSLVDSTYIVDVPVGEGWVFFDFVNNANITASTEYAIAIIAEANGGDCKIDFNTTGGSHVGETGGSYGVWPSDWTTANQGGTFDFSIYAYYTPAEEEAVGTIIMIQ